MASNDNKNSGPPTVLGWIALTFGMLSIGAGILGQVGVIPEPDFPIGGLGLALFVGGYIICFDVPPIYSRLDRLEQRIDDSKTPPE